MGKWHRNEHKSIDLTAATHQDAARLTYRLNVYVDKIALYEGGKMGTLEIAPGTDIESVVDRMVAIVQEAAGHKQ
jgi:hypothetical protein